MVRRTNIAWHTHFYVNPEITPMSNYFRNWTKKSKELVKLEIQFTDTIVHVLLNKLDLDQISELKLVRNLIEFSQSGYFFCRFGRFYRITADLEYNI